MDLFPQDVAIMNDLFVQLLMGNFLEYKRQGVQNFVLGSDLVDYAKGKKV